MKKHIDVSLVVAVLLLSIFGVIMIYSASYVWSTYKYEDAFHYVKHQALFLVLGVVIMYFVSKFNYRNYYVLANKLLVFAISLLVLVIIPGIGTIRNGSRSWFGIGSFGLQPSEFAKLAIIIFTAKYLTNQEKELKNIKKGVLPIFFVTLLIFGLILLQPDFGTGVILVMSVIGVLFVGGVNFNFFFKLAGIGLVGIIGLIAIAPYRLARILSFLNPWSDPLGSGFQIIQSLYAIGPGGLFGFGFLNSRQKHFYLPEPQTDFIFSIISEEFGFMGILIIASLFITVIIRGFKISRNCQDKFGKYLAFGLIFQIAFQSVLNLMVVVGLIPVTGVTLPFLSYGGSSLLITLVEIGVVLNISKYVK